VKFVEIESEFVGVFDDEDELVELFNRSSVIVVIVVSEDFVVRKHGFRGFIVCI
jgi:hypothetical protein